jgi:hypothetical protein
MAGSNRKGRSATHSFAAGKVPSDVNETWTSFKTAVRNFNSKLLTKTLKKSKR